MFRCNQWCNGWRRDISPISQTLSITFIHINLSLCFIWFFLIIEKTKPKPSLLSQNKTKKPLKVLINETVKPDQYFRTFSSMHQIKHQQHLLDNNHTNSSALLPPSTLLRLSSHLHQFIERFLKCSNILHNCYFPPWARSCVSRPWSKHWDSSHENMAAISDKIARRWWRRDSALMRAAHFSNQKLKASAGNRRSPHIRHVVPSAQPSSPSRRRRGVVNCDSQNKKTTFC